MHGNKSEHDERLSAKKQTDAIVSLHTHDCNNAIQTNAVLQIANESVDLERQMNLDGCLLLLSLISSPTASYLKHLCINETMACRYLSFR